MALGRQFLVFVRNGQGDQFGRALSVTQRHDHVLAAAGRIAHRRAIGVAGQFDAADSRARRQFVRPQVRVAINKVVPASVG